MSAAFPSPVGQTLWSPDGTRLRFTLDDINSHTSSTWEIAADRVDSEQQPQRISMGPSCCVDWTWIENGKTLAYVQGDGFALGKGLILRSESVPPGRIHEIEIPAKIGVIGALASAGTSHLLYLIAGSAYRGELLKFNAREKALQTYLPGISATFLAFSPDGQWITYVDTVDWTLWRSRADGSETLRLTSPAMHGNVFCEKTQDCWIRLLDMASRKTEMIAGSNGFRTARWSPDGKYIAALNFEARGLMLFDVARQRWRRLADSVAGDNINWSSDSRFVYADSPRDKKPVIERVRVPNGQRSIVVDLASMSNVPGQLNNWMGLTPDNAPILGHILSNNEVYELKWADQ